MKSKLLSSLGSVGLVLYYIGCLLVSVLPPLMIGKSFFITLLIISVQQFIPATSAIFWVWGLVCAIQGRQDIFAYIYYVLFVVLFIPYFISIIASIIQPFLGNKG